MMSVKSFGRLAATILALAGPARPGLAADLPSPTPDATVTLVGEAVLLTSLLDGLSSTFDTDPIATQVVVKGNDGRVTPLLSDDASRALFQDDRLRDRRIEVVGRRLAGLPYLQVLSFQVEDQGRLRSPEYYCEICAIAVRSPQVCPCCQGPLELRMRPER